MNKQGLNKDKELARLAGEVFDGADPCWNYAAMDSDQNWYLYAAKPIIDDLYKHWLHSGVKTKTHSPCELVIEFHKTSLDWTETLLRRGDYE